MKKIIIALLIMGAGGYGWHLYHSGLYGLNNPDEIVNPIYADIHLNMELNGRGAEAVIYAKTVDQADCQKSSKQVIETMLGHQGQNGAPTVKVKSSECKAKLLPRHAKLFNNKPTQVTYVSLARGTRTEREARWIFWGVTAKQNDRICRMVPDVQKHWKGAETCIHALGISH